MLLGVSPAGTKIRFPSFTTTSSATSSNARSSPVLLLRASVCVRCWPKLAFGMITAGLKEMEGGMLDFAFGFGCDVCGPLPPGPMVGKPWAGAGVQRAVVRAAAITATILKRAAVDKSKLDMRLLAFLSLQLGTT